MRREFVLRFGPITRRFDMRLPLVLGILALIAFGGIVVSIGIGDYYIAPGDVIRTLLGQGTGRQPFIVNTLRLPRSLTAFLVGAALGLSGGILQGLTRNPLASPDVVGLTGGASAFAAAVILLRPGAPLWMTPLAAFTGALLAGSITYALAYKGGTSPLRLVLVGIGVASAAQAITSFIVVTSKTLILNNAMIWMAGSVYGRSWDHLRLLFPWLLVLVPVALILGRHLDALHLGDDVARSVGSAVERNRALLLLTAIGLAGGAVAVAGAVGFVGLMAPHIARRLVGARHGSLLPTAALVGGATVVLADLAGRTAFSPFEIPAGLITAAIGGPYFLYLLLRDRHA